MNTAFTEEPVPVWEVMTELNSRSVFGRIVVNPPTRMSNLKPHKTGEAWYFCLECKRAFLHRDKLHEHNMKHTSKTQKGKKRVNITVTSKASKPEVKARKQYQVQPSTEQAKLEEEFLKHELFNLCYKDIPQPATATEIVRQNPVAYVWYDYEDFPPTATVTATEIVKKEVLSNALYKYKDVPLPPTATAIVETKIETHRHKCHDCGKVCPTSESLAQHLERHKGPYRYECSFCGIGFQVSNYHQRHLKSSHDPSNTFQCQKCCCKFESFHGLYRHEALYHITEKGYSITRELERPGNEIPEEYKKIRKEWLFSFNNKLENSHSKPVTVTPLVQPQPEQMASHSSRSNTPTAEIEISKEHVEVQPEGEKIESVRSSSRQVRATTRKSYNSLLRLRPQNSFQCDICQKVLNTAVTLKFHKRIHSGEMPYQCKHCGIKFRLYGTRQKHMKNIHGGTGKFKCCFCNSSFGREAFLQKHYYLVHKMKQEQ